MSRLDLRQTAVPATRIEPTHGPVTVRCGQVRGLITLRAARDAGKPLRDWRGAMIDVIRAARGEPDDWARGSRPAIRLEPSAIEVDDAMIEEALPEPSPRAWRTAMVELITTLRDGGGAIRAATQVALIAIAMSACSSLVDDPCASGYMWQVDTCVPRLFADAPVAPDVMSDGDATPPDGLPPDGPMPDGLPPDGAMPDGAMPDGAMPDGAMPDGAMPDGAMPDGTPDAPPDGAPPDAPPDGAVPDAPADASVLDATPPDAPVCPAPSLTCHGVCTDVMTSPTDCGTCGHVCASGICTAGVCAGELVGHVVAIGHDYQQHNAAMARVLGNAAALASADDLGIAHVAGTATAASRAGTATALGEALTVIGRPSHAVALPAVGQPLVGIDVLVIDAQTGDGVAAEQLGTQWKPSIDELLARHGVVIVVEGAAGQSHRFAAGAGLFSVAPPVDTTGSPAFVTAAGDAVVQQVVSPYLADTTSVVFPAVSGAIATPSGTVVIHLTR